MVVGSCVCVWMLNREKEREEDKIARGKREKIRRRQTDARNVCGRLAGETQKANGTATSSGATKLETQNDEEEEGGEGEEE